MNNSAFMTDDFLLNTNAARRLYHDYAESIPIYDFHSRLSPKDIATNRQFDNLTQTWLQPDIFKWRAMRGAGIEERLISGKASDWEKFEAWARVVPQTLCHPLFHWTHLELKKPFGIRDKLLNSDTAKAIWETCNDMLKDTAFRTRELLAKWNVEVLFTNNSPIDTLEFHNRLKNQPDNAFHIYPTFCISSALNVGIPKIFNEWVSRLERSAAVYISDHISFLEALKKRHDYFHEMGCRLSECSLLKPVCANYSVKEIKQTFADLRAEKRIPAPLGLKFISWILHEVAVMNAEKGWTQQINIGALPNANSRMFRRVGSNAGFDIVSDGDIIAPLVRFFDRLARIHRLPKTLANNLNPKDNMALCTVLGAFNNHTTPGKMQLGMGYWSFDQKEGTRRQLETLSMAGILNHFAGIQTNTRSFLSFSRHEYFRRVLCDYLGDQIDKGMLPADFDLIGQMVKNICYDNAKQYFQAGQDTIPKNLPGKPRDHAVVSADAGERNRNRRRKGRGHRPKEGRKKTDVLPTGNKNQSKNPPGSQTPPNTSDSAKPKDEPVLVTENSTANGRLTSNEPPTIPVKPDAGTNANSEETKGSGPEEPKTAGETPAKQEAPKTDIEFNISLSTAPSPEDGKPSIKTPDPEKRTNDDMPPSSDST